MSFDHSSRAYKMRNEDKLNRFLKEQKQIFMEGLERRSTSKASPSVGERGSKNHSVGKASPVYETAKK